MAPFFEDAMYENSIHSDEGYVVAGLSVKTGKRKGVIGFNVIFAKLDGEKLNLKDLRRSAWIGSGSALDNDVKQIVSRQGKPVVGITVVGEGGVSALGIVLKQN